MSTGFGPGEGEGVSPIAGEDSPEMPSRVPRALAGFLSMVLGTAYLIHTLINYGYGDLARPGPGLFPTFIGVGTIAFGGLVTTNALMGRNLDEGEERSPDGNRRLLLMSMLLLFYITGIFIAGFTIASLASTYAMLAILDAPLSTPKRVLYCVILVGFVEGGLTLLVDIGFPGSLLSFLR